MTLLYYNVIMYIEKGDKEMKEEIENLLIQKDKELQEQYKKMKQLEKEYEILVKIIKMLEGK